MGGRLGGDGGVVGIAMFTNIGILSPHSGWVCVKTRSSYVKGDNKKQLLAAWMVVEKVLVICL